MPFLGKKSTLSNLLAKEDAVIPQRYAGYVFAFIMSGVMSLFISLINIGAVDGIVGI